MMLRLARSTQDARPAGRRWDTAIGAGAAILETGEGETMNQQQQTAAVTEVRYAVESLAQVAQESFDAAEMNSGPDPEAMLRVLALGLRTIAADLQAIEDGAVAGDADAAEVGQ